VLIVRLRPRGSFCGQVFRGHGDRVTCVCPGVFHYFVPLLIH
jgi:hypothetical protein